MKPLRRISHRLVWSGVDQALSSASNFGLSLLVARSVSAREFGAFAVGYMAYMLSVGLSRSFASEPLLVRYPREIDHEIDGDASRSLGFAVTFGSILGGAVALIAWALQPPVRPILLALGVCLPGLLLQDAARFVLFAKGLHRAAAGNDFLWTVMASTGVVAGWILGVRPTAAVLLLVWGISGSIAGIIALAQARLVPIAPPLQRWLAAESRLGWALAWDFLFAVGASQIAITLVGPIAGLEQLGGIRGAGTLLGPLNIVLVGARVVALPELVRARKAGPTLLRKRGVILSIGLAAICVVWGLVSFLLPSGVGRSLLGDSWVLSHEVIPWMTLLMVARAGAEGACAGLRVISASKALVTARSIAAPAVIVLGALGALAGGGVGAALGIAVSNLGAMVLFWAELLRSDRPEIGPGGVAMPLGTQPPQP